MSTAAGPLPLVELWDIDLRLSLIVATPSGVKYTNQVGGHACLHPSLEGVLIPLSTEALAPNDPLENYYESQLREDDAKPETRNALVSRWLEWAELLDVFEPHPVVEVAEAWIPVRVRQNVPERVSPLLAAFAGSSGVLTYQNSD